MNAHQKPFIIRFLSAPVFEGDENKSLVARILHVILLILLVAICIAFFLAVSGRAEVTNRTFFNISAVIGPLSAIGLLIALHKGYVRFVAWAFVSFQWLSTVIQVIGSNGFESPALGGFIATILFAGFLISRGGVIVFGAMSVLAMLSIWTLETNGLLPPPIIFESLPAKLFIELTIVAIATTLLYMVMRTLQKALENSQTYAAKLEQVIQAKTNAEKEIISLNEQLQNQVAELERFTYTVSHDLRSPLVTIKGFIGMLDKDLKENHHDKVQDDFKRISAAAEKMDALLSELLELSRIGRIVNPPTEIDTVRLVQDAIDSVDARIRSRNVTVNIAPNLPVIHGDRIRLREVFENLIDNAVKYMGEQDDPVIEIGVRNQVGETVFYVKDNGIGIEEQYQEKIFGLFEKLDSTVEGTGIGLALVKRIIETHGGRIWVESEGLGKGSAFCFTIPDRKNT